MQSSHFNPKNHSINVLKLSFYGLLTMILLAQLSYAYTDIKLLNIIDT